MSIARLCLTAGALLLLASCGRSSPVARNAVDPPPNSVGDAPGARFNGQGDAARREEERSAARPAPTDGLAWRWDSASKAARFGVPPNGTSFSIACDQGRLVFRRFDGAPAGASATMSFTGSGRVASVPAKSIGDPAKLSSLWESVETPSDRTAGVARVFAGAAPVEIALAGTTALVAPASPIPARAFEACARAAR